VAEGESPSDRIILEKSMRLSQSMLWKLQMAAYCTFGPEAWSTKGVPFYVTSNPFIARQYAQVVLGFIRDCLAPTAPTPLRLEEPVYILDLGAGSGRFAYMFLKSLHQILGSLGREELNICYVMTDAAQSNIDYWLRHPYLQGFIQENMLDAAFYHHQDPPSSLHLMKSGKELSEHTLKNPLIVIGNYFFDTIPQDLFLAKEGQLFEGRVTLTIPKNEETQQLSKEDPAVISYLRDEYEYVPIENVTDYYLDLPELNAILTNYRQRFDHIYFQFPIGSFHVIKFLHRLSNGRFLLLAGDQGRSTEEGLKEYEPLISKHGSFSISVNYHAISMYIRSLNGVSLLTTYPDPMFVVMAAILGGEIENYRETILAFKTHIDYFEPNDYVRIINYSEKEWVNPSIEVILLLLKLGNWDPMNFHYFFKTIRRHASTSSPSIKHLLAETIHNVWNNFFPIHQSEGAFVMNLGVLLYEIERYEDALQFFQRAIDLGFENEVLYANIASSYFKLDDLEQGMYWYHKAEKAKKSKEAPILSSNQR
jgi:tetratricopeptide (TPR) repeat protein